MEVETEITTTIKVRVQQSRFSALLILLFSLFAFSCSERGGKIEEINRIIDGSSKYSYCYSSLSDSAYYDLALSLIVSSDFPYDRLNFELEVIDADTLIVVDTLSMPIERDFILKEKITSSILSDIRLNRGDYCFNMRGLMPPGCVGIEDIKLRIVPKN